MAAPRDLYSFRRMLIVLLATVVAPVLSLSAVGLLAVKNERAALEQSVDAVFQPRLEQLAAELSREAVVQPGDAQRLSDARFGHDGTQYVVEPAQTSGAVVAVALSAPHQDLQVAVYEPYGQSLTARVVRNRAVYLTLIALFLGAVVTGVTITGRTYYIHARLARLQTDFVNNVSHELRTPLTSIRMFIETLQLERAKDPAKVQECLTLLATETERLSNMIERMLSWARMEAGRRSYQLKAERAGDLVETAVNAFRAQSLGKPYELTLDLPAAETQVLADKDALVEAVLNLLSNAFKYSGDEKKIRVTVAPAASAGWTLIEVADNGIGISPRDRKRIFDKFYRAEQLLSRKTEGTGLGLSMVRHIVQGHRGRIECQSEPGKGSRFRVFLRNAVVAPETLRVAEARRA